MSDMTLFDQKDGPVVKIIEPSCNGTVNFDRRDAQVWVSRLVLFGSAGMNHCLADEKMKNRMENP